MKRRKTKKTPKTRPLNGHGDFQGRLVEDPDYSRDHEEGKLGNRRFASAVVNVRESAVETLFARNFLAQSQKRAADHFRSLWEAAGGKSSSIDYTQDRVDGGCGDPIVARLTAAKELEHCRALLGSRHFNNIEKLCGQGRTLSDLARNKRDRLTLADNLRADLDDLAVRWGMRTRGR